MEQATGRAQDKRDRDQEENMEANWLAGHFQDAQALVSKGRKQNDPCVSAKEEHGRVNKREEQKRDESKRGSESEGDSDSDSDTPRSCTCMSVKASGSTCSTSIRSGRIVPAGLKLARSVGRRPRGIRYVKLQSSVASCACYAFSHHVILAIDC